MRAVFLAVALVLAWPIAAGAEDFKIPPTPDHYVTDNAGALSEATRSSLENELQAYEQATGHQVIVWIAQSTGDVPLETFTTETADRWKIGRHGKDDGAVLFVFMKDRKVRIEVGYGLEGSLTDADSYRIIQGAILPKMRSGDVDSAVSAGVAGMLTTITPSYKGVEAPKYSTHDSGSLSTFWIWAAILLFVLILHIIRTIWYGWLVMSEGGLAAKRDMRRGFWGGAFIGSMSGGGSGGGGFGGGGFSAGGGGFGGGGASGGW